MGKRIVIVTEATGEVSAEILEEKNPRTAEEIWDNLPFTARANTWGDEIYFSVPVRLGPENPQEVVELGDLGYWPPGHAFCIFFGATPASVGEEIRPASEVNIFGKVLGDPLIFKRVRSGDTITVKRAE